MNRIPTGDDVIHDDTTKGMREDGDLATVGLKPLVALPEHLIQIVHLLLNALYDLNHSGTKQDE